jgi:hypothetical protein
MRVATVVLLMSGHGGLAHAQSSQGADTVPTSGEAPAYWDQTVSAPRRAIELSLSPSFVMGTRAVAGNARDSVTETLASGTSAALGLGYRASSAWELEIGGAYEFYDKGPAAVATASARGGWARVSTTYHFAPNARTDPWFRGGAGYRWLEESVSAANSHEFRGFELMSLAAGLDLRVDRHFAFGPALGAGLDLFLWDGSRAAADPRPGIFWNLGLLTRFDFGGRARAATDVAAR